MQRGAAWSSGECHRRLPPHRLSRRRKVHTQRAPAPLPLPLPARQRDLLWAVSRSAEAARDALAGGLGPAVAAEELYEGLSQLDQLMGRDTREDALDRLFQRFCVGK